MEVILTGLLVMLTGYQFYHPSVETGVYTPVAYQGKMDRFNTRTGVFEICDEKFQCVDAGLQIKQEFKPEVSAN